MRFPYAGTDIEVRPEITAAFDREWDRLGAPGSFWTGAERIAIAFAARAAREGWSLGDLLESPVADIAGELGVDPGGRTRAWAEAAVGLLGAARFVELVGIVARGAAVDAFHRSIGADLAELPPPVAGDPDGVEDDRAASGPAWVPMVGGASIVHALSLVPAEAAAQEDLHGPLYLTYHEMNDLGFQRGLSRAQMEVVAARTSALNECFYWVLAHSLMLRASVEASGQTLDPRFVTDPAIDPGVPGGRALVALVDAVVGGGDSGSVRDLLRESLGDSAAVDAAGVIANFEMMNRIADATGMPVGKGTLARTEEFRLLAGIDRFRHG